jgi:thioredoxin 1
MTGSGAFLEEPLLTPDPCLSIAVRRNNNMTNATTLELNQGNFQDEVLASDRPVLVGFWAPWCQPCRMLGPTIDDLARRNEGRLKVGKVNVDDNQSLAGEYGISSIPTLLLFKGGEVVRKIVGLVSLEELEESIDAHTASTATPPGA